jgi:hypothetical protein
MKEDKVFIQITNETIYNEMKAFHDKNEKQLNQILEQARLTNGRVTRLENVGLGMWIRNNPFKFAAGCILFVMIFISDIRHPIIELIKTLIF